MYYKTIIFSLFITLGLSLPIFPVARPYIPSGIGTLPLITTSDFIVARAKDNDADDGAVIPEKWRHTHGKLFEETEAEKRYMGGECRGDIACGSDVQAVKEVVQERDLGDCKEGIWGC
ncbi:hypothetical protein BKA58DRAFT_442969 [Alternaria rosae]|uniref:uncharacterized protein n=1 Tax=Alternaria rosae TaxID=1187941 RepID=UPI001E8D6DAA|nr:uncharacterized protein BKA58DRAFT_442969 [Alternaria rosae]KAH6864905.1 hypothetical protein BKA58DRAFT_442969 [Alternaria rosae]